MRKLIFTLLIAAAPLLVQAAGGGVPLDRANVDLSDKASLQNGAKLFVNYCLSCHSAAYQRFNRTGQDLGLTEDQVKENLMFTTDKVGSPMTVAMNPAAAEQWFGVTPPDLSVTARSRGADWLYTYMRSFYLDDGKPWGVNNSVFPDVGMPHVLWELEGLKKPVYRTVETAGDSSQVIASYQQVMPGKMNQAEYDGAVRDLVNFMVYMGEPAAMHRERIGMWVLAFLVVFTFVAYLLKKEYWKDVH